MARLMESVLSRHGMLDDKTTLCSTKYKRPHDFGVHFRVFSVAHDRSTIVPLIAKCLSITESGQEPESGPGGDDSCSECGPKLALIAGLAHLDCRPLQVGAF